MDELIYRSLRVRYEVIYSKNIKNIEVFIKGIKIAGGLLQFLELVAIFEGFLANQLPKGKYPIVIRNKTPYLTFSDGYERIYMDKGAVRIYLKILKQFEKKIDIFVAGKNIYEEFSQ